jgi:HEAT repeat protein
MKLTIRDHIDALSQNQKWSEASAEAMRRNVRRAVRPLLTALETHVDQLVREGCAKLPGEAEDTKAIPGLIEALKDESQHVRWDALASLNRILMIELNWWLRIEVYRNKPSP